MVIEIKGNWKKGFALDLHTEKSIYLGQDEYGHDQFNTTRTEIGQLVYSLKYKKKMSVIPEIISKISSSLTLTKTRSYQ